MTLRDATSSDRLAALVELLELNTDLSIREDGIVESHTTASYKVKNAADQFIDIALPDGAKPLGGRAYHYWRWTAVAGDGQQY